MKLFSMVKSSDERMFCMVNHKIRCRFLDRWLSKITHLGGAVCSVGLLAVLLISGYCKLDGVAALLFSHLLVHLLKKRVGRKRPYLVVRDAWVTPHPLQDYSFPSGHTTAICSIAMSLFMWHPWVGLLLFSLAFMVALSRIYLGHHYPTDVTIGAVIGIGTAAICHDVLASYM